MWVLNVKVVDWKEGELKAGQKVRLEFRMIYADGHAGPIQYGYKAVPA